VTAQEFGVVEGEHDLGEFGLAVRLDAVPGVFEEQIVEVEGGLPCGADVDDAGPRGAGEERGERAAEHVGGQVVDLEGQFDAVVAGPAGEFDAEAGVVDQDVESVAGGDAVGEGADLFQGGEVGVLVGELGISGLLA